MPKGPLWINPPASCLGTGTCILLSHGKLMETHLCVGTGQKLPALPARSVPDRPSSQACPALGPAGYRGLGHTRDQHTPRELPGPPGREQPERGRREPGAPRFPVPCSNRNRTSKYERGHTKDESDDLKHGVKSKGDPRAQPADTAPPGMAGEAGQSGTSFRLDIR